ncbi:hypothetical protein HBH53_036650 [Parastagonospora nodorum]|nr:hypothetical protein HBH53_036650 [Parastagonospora nodorum]KAH4949662.1 hypothetical protein HBH74_023700 [Parastagonospora nodorum]KAH4960194.1 hypothetical protein HBH73_080010 [Parastagonospora nodorum]KAH5050507.1 hypothetical protein HBH96_184490 [Parastagonospora nodorum]KAH5182751.1 hypothetical protein HBH76_154710 [Parastagonospora nodorum]
MTTAAHLPDAATAFVVHSLTLQAKLLPGAITSHHVHRTHAMQHNVMPAVTACIG